MIQLEFRFDGADVVPTRDFSRLNNQLERVKTLMLDGQWRTLEEISKATGDPTLRYQRNLGTYAKKDLAIIK